MFQAGFCLAALQLNNIRAVVENGESPAVSMVGLFGAGLGKVPTQHTYGMSCEVIVAPTWRRMLEVYRICFNFV